MVEGNEEFKERTTLERSGCGRSMKILRKCTRMTTKCRGGRGKEGERERGGGNENKKGKNGAYLCLVLRYISTSRGFFTSFKICDKVQSISIGKVFRD